MNKKFLKIKNKKFRYNISCLTAYTPSIAKILDGNVDIILVGDSLGSTIYGMKNTQGVTLKMMKEHGLAVIKNIRKSFTIIDMPYKTYDNKNQALKNAKDLINYTKTNFIKLEIDESKLEIIKYLSKNKIDTIAHIGVTPQSYKNFKDIKVLGKTKSEKDQLLKLAINAETCGAKIILLECVTSKTAKLITSTISIPTIGIGASKYCDGQVLVFDDLVNFSADYLKPKFVKNYMNFSNLAKIAVKKYKNDIKFNKFPSKKYSYD